MKSVGRCAGLECAAAEELRAGCGDFFGDGEGLLAGFNGAGAGDDGEVTSANGGVCAVEADDGVFFFAVATGEFVSLGDADDFGDAGEFLEVAAVGFALVAGDADGGALCAGEGMRA